MKQTENTLFDIDRIKEQIEFNEKNPPKHYIGAVSDGVVHSYSLAMKYGEDVNFILSKQYVGEDKKEMFWEEVKNLQKYFNATVNIEKNEKYKTLYSQILYSTPLNNERRQD